MAARFARAGLLPVGGAAVALLLPAPVLAAALATSAGAAGLPSTDPGGMVLAAFLQDLARWLQYLAGLVAVVTVAYGGLRHAAATSPHAQAEAWRIVIAGLGGLVIALLAPTIVAIVTGMIPS